MNGAQINTSQNVSIDYNLADIGERVVAKILDTLFILGYLLFCLAIFIGVAYWYEDNLEFFIENDGAIAITIYLVMMIPVFFYSLWAPYFMQGQTFGKKIMKLKIVKVDGSEAGFSTYLIRWLLNIIDSLFYYIVGLVVMGTTEKRQRVADLVAKTVVISTKPKMKIDQTILAQIDENYTPTFTQVLQLSDNDIQIISKTLTRIKATSDYSMLSKLREKIESVIHESKPELTDMDYVQTVIKDYQYFSQQ
ncbi:RDD family protein [Apibacter muscae]|uniref:RDD family protein n=1 Tax=Apibacter muscae TaxID=2509004 RepID=UPI0011AD36D2|nr:RDD family protein [Apibacter muscae]TWP30338.1 RDD family protein [Apibacter muscae]